MYFLIIPPKQTALNSNLTFPLRPAHAATFLFIDLKTRESDLLNHKYVKAPSYT